MGYYSWYNDPLPTNCVVDWICPGGTGCGYPEFVHRPGTEYGKKRAKAPKICFLLSRITSPDFVFSVETPHHRPPLP